MKFETYWKIAEKFIPSMGDLRHKFTPTMGGLRTRLASSDEMTYFILLLASIPLGFLFKRHIQSFKVRAWVSSIIGFAIVLAVCRLDAFHSITLFLVNTAILKSSLPHTIMPWASFGWCFGYLLFFRVIHFFSDFLMSLIGFGVPAPISFANAVQLILTLKSVGLAFEITDSENRKTHIKELKDKISKDTTHSRESDVAARDEVELEHASRSVNTQLSFVEIFQYSFCYIGLFTGPYFKFRTYIDWLAFDHPQNVRSWGMMMERAKFLPVYIFGFLVLSQCVSAKDVTDKKFYDHGFIYLFIYMALMFTIFRLRFYIAWALAEMSCMSACLGAYPEAAESKPGCGPTKLHELKKSHELKASKVHYDFKAVHNIDEYKVETAPTVKSVLHYWNMTVQYWMAENVYRRIPNKLIGQPVTMAVSAFWHGIHAGYYLSMLTTTPCIWAEQLMEKGLKNRLPESLHGAYNVVSWFLRCRVFDYMSMGFILLSFTATVRFWGAVYFAGHVACGVFIALGALLSMLPIGGSSEAAGEGKKNKKEL